MSGQAFLNRTRLQRARSGIRLRRRYAFVTCRICGKMVGMSSPSKASLSVPLQSGREAFVTQAQRFVSVAQGLDDYALLAASRCHGWAVLDVVVHVRSGLEEMLRGVTAPTEQAPTVDAATYWSAWAESDGAGPSVDAILWTRRTASAYRLPSSAVRHLRDAADAIMDAAARLTDHSLEFQGHVILAGDFLAIWAVELAVHHVDLGRDLEIGDPTDTALRLTRDTIDALLGTPVPTGVCDLDALLIGSGRIPAPQDQPRLRAVLG